MEKPTNTTTGVTEKCPVCGKKVTLVWANTGSKHWRHDDRDGCAYRASKLWLKKRGLT